MSRIKKGRMSSDEIDYNQKLTFDLSLKKLNDSFEEKAEKLISEDKSQK